MTNTECKVYQTVQWVRETLGRMVHPRSRQRLEDVYKLLEEISTGSGSPEHLEAIEMIGQGLVREAPDKASEEAGREILQVLGGEWREIFLSHIETHICPSGDCLRLVPAPCQMACPAGIDVSGYVALIGAGKYAEAVELIREDNPFPWVCGLVCTHPCEFMCVRGRVDDPIAIKDLKAFAAERALSEGAYRNPPRAPDNGHKVCIVGAGPAGLTAAYYLRLKGYQVTVIEALPYAGGMMMVGIPRYRLPREVIDREVGMIESLGVEFRFGTRLGRDLTIEELRQEGFGAFFIAIGAHDAYKMRIPGEDDFPQVVDAVTFLRRVAMGERQRPGGRVAVIGGGNVAIDAARTALRLGAEDVMIVYRRTRSEMPASEEEVLQAEEEGVCFSFLTAPIRITGSEGRIRELHCIRTELGPPDESGRRRPVPVEGSEFVIPLDAVIPAIGQIVDPEGLEPLEGLKWSRRKTLVVHRATMEASSPGVFAGGDVVLGPATVVEAIGAGKRAAWAIDRYFQGIPQPKQPPVPVRRQRLGFEEVPAAVKMALRRPDMPLLRADRRRITFQQVELGLSEALARDEARRCLRCDICIRCGRCVEICRDKMGIDALKLGYLDVERPTPTDFRVTAERCILCGACAANCPSGALQMVDRDGERLLMLCGTVLNRLKLEYCQACGAVLGPARYHDYIAGRLRDISPLLRDKTLCIDCARKALAEAHAEISPSSAGL